MKIKLFIVAIVLSFTSYAQFSEVRTPIHYYKPILFDSLRIKPSDTTGSKTAGNVIYKSSDKTFYIADGIKFNPITGGGGGGPTIVTTGTVAELRAMSVNPNTTYFSTDRGGGRWSDDGLYDGQVIDDGALYIVTSNNRVLKRVYDGVKRPEWFGLNGTSDDVAINAAFGNNPGKVSLTPGVYHLAAPIRMTKGQILEGNKAIIISTSTTNIIEGRNELINGAYQHTHAEIRDVTLKSSTAKNALNLKGFKNSIIQNLVVELTSADTNTIGVHFQHGTSGNEQCYFNSLNNSSIYLDGPGTAIMFSGSGASGANVNFVNGGIVSGYDRYAVRMKDNSVGNKIDGLDAEHWSVTSDTAYLIGSPLNTIIAPHIENYATAIRVTGNANKFVGLSSAVINSQYIDEGSGNSFEGLTSNGSGYAMSIGGDLNLGSYTKLRVAGDIFPSIRIDSKNSNPDSRNWALRAGFSGNEFDFTRSDAKDGDPVAAGTPMWSINAQGHFVLPKQLKFTDITQYNTNAAAAGDGWSNGFFYTTPDGIVRSIKSSVGGTHVEHPTANDHAVRLDDMNAAIAGISGGQFALSGTDIYNTNTGKIGLGNSTPLEKLDVSSLDLFTRMRVGHGTGATTGVNVEWNNSIGRGQISTTGNYTLFFGVNNRRQFNVNDQGLTIGETLSYYNTKGPENGLLVEGRVKAARATEPDDLVTKYQLDSAGRSFTVNNSVGTGDTLLYFPNDSTATAKRIEVIGATKDVTATKITYTVNAPINGTVSFTGDGSTTSFTIPLSVAGLNANSKIFFDAKTPIGAAVNWVEKSTESITIYYLTAPTSGLKTLNYILVP